MKQFRLFVFNIFMVSILMYLSGFLFGENMYLGGDYNGFLSFYQLSKNIYVWHDNSFVFYNIPLYIKYFYTYIFYFLGFSLEKANFLGFLSIFLIGLYSFYLFIKFTLKDYLGNINVSDKIYFLFSYFYITSSYFVIRFVDGHIDFMVFYYFLPLVLLTISQFIYTEKIKYFIFSILLIIFGLNIYISPYLVFFGLIIILIYIFLYNYYIKKITKGLIVKFIYGFLVFLFLSLPFLVNYYLYKSSLNLEKLGTNPIGTIKNISGMNHFFDFLLGYGYWAIRDGFSGNYYYTFHNIFDNILYLIYKILGLIGIIYGFFVFKNNKKIKKIYLLFLIIFLFSIFLQYFLFYCAKEGYDNIILFIINKIPFLREPVAKIEGLYYFSFTILIILLYVGLKKKLYSKFILYFIFIGIFINSYMVYYSFKGRYSTNFIKINYINSIKKVITNLNYNDRYIVLPGNADLTCINNNTKFCGVLPLKGLSYSEFYTAGAGGISLKFSKDEKYDNFIKKLENKGINKILIKKDYKYFVSGSEYEKRINLLLKILKDNKKIVYKGQKYDIISLGNRNYGYFEGINISDIKSNNTIDYKINIKLKEKGNLIFFDNFNKYWKLYLKNQQGLFTPPLFDNTHKKIYDYANSWTISKQGIIDYVNKYYGDELKKEGYPKKLPNGQLDYKYYKLNPDGSIDVELTLYFKPQLYFYIGLIISGTTFLLLILWLIVDSVKNRKKERRNWKIGKLGKIL